MPIYKRSEAKESGWSQVRAALTKFEMNVAIAEDGKWGDGKEYLEIKGTNLHVLEASEELSMDVEGQEFNFRENCSMSNGSFWVDEFLASADENKILLPDGLINKRVTFLKKTKLAFNKDGTPNPKYNSTNYVIAGVAPIVAGVAPVASAPVVAPAVVASVEDPMAIALELAVGKTETQFRSAIGLHPLFANSPLLGMAKAGMVTLSLVKEGRLVEVKDGNKTVYAKPG